VSPPDSNDATRSCHGQNARPARDSPFVVSCGFLLTSNPRAQTSVAAPPSQTIPADAEELIAEKPPSCPALDDEDVASANGRKVAWRCPTNDRWTVFVNGVPQGGGFEEARWLIFSPDGQHMAFAARRDKRWMIVESDDVRGGGSPRIQRRR
jgi:hypothetical protein